jgi:response regulator RpfG family c-di-GMP phosphodiesterase
MSLPDASDHVKQTVISVGQCGYDNSRIRSLIRSIDSTVEIKETDSHQETMEVLASLGEAALVLVNRVFDMDGASGMEFISQLKSKESQFAGIPVMLVSNYEKSQAEAIANGAISGFGKSELQSVETRRKIESVLNRNI